MILWNEAPTPPRVRALRARYSIYPTFCDALTIHIQGQKAAAIHPFEPWAIDKCAQKVKAVSPGTLQLFPDWTVSHLSLYTGNTSWNLFILLQRRDA